MRGLVGEPLPAGREVGFSRHQLARDLRALGVRPGQDLLIHSSLRRVGRIDGGAATLLAAIQDAAVPEATIVVPTQTAYNSLSSRTFLASVAGLNQEERASFIARMPGFDPAVTPSAGMGAFAEYVRRRPAAFRSNHPQTSFAALGPTARACTSVHDLDCHLGDRSPLGWLYKCGAAILLLGVGYSVCTSFHLAEYRLPGERPVRRYRCFTAGPDGRVEREFSDIDLDDSDFGLLGAELDAAPHVRQGLVGRAPSRLLSLTDAVDFAHEWLRIHRQEIGS